MPVSADRAMRGLVTAVVLLLAALLGMETASAQAIGQDGRTAATAPAYAAVPHEHSGTAEDDCKPRHGPRRATAVQAPARAPARMCGCDAEWRTGRRWADSVTVREGPPRSRSVGVPVLHQTFRC
ncbi:hypothetical protein [Streptomyces winkii]|uniref:hypothetical protein n=1 Tax=Streptomyces winkii TaxID=3051178 RepID=UPI0028D89ECC|nr:hypothetical protein [Streptomyces sp. DSM 40971]